MPSSSLHQDIELLFAKFDDVFQLPKRLPHSRMIIRNSNSPFSSAIVMVKKKDGKCSFGTTQVEYLRHIISAGSIYMDPTKVDGCGVITKPFTALLKKEVPWNWSHDAQVAFEQLKQAVYQGPFLILPVF
ncbi:uncharacterized protein [Gossypium hirsutum]|uniref:Reverse transcriptase/retrotransposon-derived protein RNase H-like domain-containing protein n=1 Tax=Gossypium hirsutum TaxID=3635 RepID=A0A1U8IZ27_GOSHI|nr:uncharacterized protein LOC107899979 [Gossypium hirsutum]